MAVNKNFVVKNGLEVATDLILANASNRRVGIGSTIPTFTLDVRGGIGATNTYITGVSTVINELRVGTGGSVFSVIAGPTGAGQSVGVGITNPAYLLDVRSPVSTGQTALYVQGDTRFTGNANIQSNLIVSGISTLSVSTSFDALRITQLGSGNALVVEDETNPDATPFIITGVGSVGVGTSVPGYLLDVRTSVSTGQTGLYVYGDAKVTGNINLDGDINIDEITTRNLNVTGLSTFAGITTVTGSTLFSRQLVVSGISTLGITTATNLTAQQLNVSGISTFAGITTVTGPTLFSRQLVVSGVTTVGSLSIGSTQVISSGQQLQNILSLDATTTATIESAIANAPNTFTDIRVSGVSTFVGLATFNNGLQVVSGVTTLGTVQISSGIVTATSGVVTYYGNGSFLTGNARNLTATIGIGTSGGVVGYGVSFIDFRGPGVSTVYYNGTTGIATVNITGGGSGSASIGIGTTPGEAFPGIVTTGNLWYNSNLGRLFIYYQDTDSAQWVDAAPFNVGIITSLSNVSFVPGSAASPSMYFVGDPQTGFFSPGSGQFTIVSTGSSVLNVNSNGINVTGITTTGELNVNTAATFSGIATHNANLLVGIGYSVGIGTNNPPYHLTVTEVGARPTPSLSYCIADFTNNINGYSQVNIRNASTASNASGDLVITTDNGTDTTNYIDLGINNTGFNNPTWTVNGPLDGYLYSSNQNFSIGVAFTDRYLSFFAGGTLAANEKMRVNDIGVGIGTTNVTTALTVVGVVSATTYSGFGANISGIVTATDFNSLSDIRYKENINTVDSALSKVDQLRGVKFDWKESGLPSYGVIAQELEEVLPELVHGNDPKTVNYNGIIGVLIEAIKELKAEIEELKNTK